MSFQPEQTAEQTGLYLDRSKRTLWGSLHGFPVFLQWTRRSGSLRFTLIANAPDQTDPSAYLIEWQRAHSGISALHYADRTLSCIIALPVRGQTEAVTRSAAELTALAADLHMIPCCMSCGSPTGFSPYLLDRSGVTLCPDCKLILENQIEQAAQNAQKKPVSIPGTALAALLTGVLVLALTWIAATLGALSWLCAYIGMTAGWLMLRKFGKKSTLPGIAAVTVCALAGLLCGTVLASAQQYAAYNARNAEQAAEYIENYEAYAEAAADPANLEALSADGTDPIADLEQMRPMYEGCKVITEHTTFSACLRDFPTVIRSRYFTEARGELSRTLLFGLIAVIAAAATGTPVMLAEARGQHTLEALPDKGA